MATFFVRTTRTLVFFLFFLSDFYSVVSLELVSYISQNGLFGTVTFKRVSGGVEIATDLNATLEFPTQVWSWSVTQFPTDYSNLEDRCDPIKLGRDVASLDDIFGYLVMPDNATSRFVTEKLEMNGPRGLYGRSLLLKNLDTRRYVCASVIISGDRSVEKTAVARFNHQIAGSVYFRWFSTKNHDRDMVVMTDLYRVSNRRGSNFGFTEHPWKIYVTDILNHEVDSAESSCNILQLVFDPETKGHGKAMGDVDVRHGKIKISNNYRRARFPDAFSDGELILLPGDLTGPHRRLYLVIFDDKHPDVFLACAKIRYELPITAKSIIQSGGIRGDVMLSQHTRFDPTVVDFNLTTARGDVETKLVYATSVASYKIHELPMAPPKSSEQLENSCLTTKFVYNPLGVDVNSQPPNGYGTQDQYPIGDLSGKLLGQKGNNFVSLVEGSQQLSGKYWDVFLPLQGKHSVVHRSMVIYKNTQYHSFEVTSEPWICGAVALYQPNFLEHRPIFTAEVLFRYPTVGRILFRQPKDDPWADTTILFEYMIHADGAQVNKSGDHRWAIHDKPPGKDFYNWTARCVSAGDIYNPYSVDFDNTSSVNNCSQETLGFCRVGDLSNRLGVLEIAGRKNESDLVARRMFTDQLLPLTGPFSILGKSLVLYDDHGPKARGERLACSKITAVYRRKAVARDWFSNGNNSTIKGRLEFYQQTEYDITDVEVTLEGLNRKSSGYHVHIAPVEENLIFPCDTTSLYDNWNPLNVDPESSPRSYHGTPDQYEMGDLSGKFGTLDNYSEYMESYNDTMLPLFGPRSIIGRSIVVHKKKDDVRWTCSTIERGYSPKEAREIRAIASFHHPHGYAYGYMKMRQLIYSDGSRSDTIIEIKLRYPGKQDRNLTRDHNWAIYVNPVGVDAAVKTQNTRCVAGGYVWNPYYTQLADPLNEELYRQECGPDNPLRCYVGDVSARVGTLDIGLRRKVVVDSNFPLEGEWSAVGRSIVILSPNRQPERYACANIEPDHDIIKYANIEKPPRFVLAQFIEDICRIMGVPDWMLMVDSRQTKYLHNDACIQILIHFKGPIASKLEQDFNRLLSTRQLEAPSLFVPGYIDSKRKSKISYRQCGLRDAEERNLKRGWYSFGGCKLASPSTTNLTICVLASLVLFIKSYM